MPRDIGTLWIGDRLSWMEQLCLRSFVDHGHSVTLFTYGPVQGVPKGVAVADGRKILKADTFLMHERRCSPAPFADRFRPRMLAARPGMVWVDADVLCLAPLTLDDGYLFGPERSGGRLSTAVLALPATGALLKAMVAATADDFAIPETLEPAAARAARQAADAGKPIPITRHPWGVWGPLLLTHEAERAGLSGRARPADVFTPVPFADRLKLLRDASEVQAMIPPAALTLHMWAGMKREIAQTHGGVPPAGSWLAAMCRRHGIDPAAAPVIAGPARAAIGEGAMLDQGALPDVQRLADLTGQPEVCLAAWTKWDCDLLLVDLLPGGTWGGGSGPAVTACRDRLLSAGVPATKVNIARGPEDLLPADLVLNLRGFGDAHKVKHLDTVLPRLLHAETRMIADIRKGSGAFPYLRGWGETEVLSEAEDGGILRSRVLFRAGANVAARAQADAPEEGWSGIARGLAGENGWFRENADHSFLFIPRGRTLVVTFDNLDIAMTKREDRRPWGFSFIEKQGWSMLGVMAGGWTWYRDPWVWQQFDDLRDSGFFAGFDRVVFYGASMGGYAACAFVAACPGADVVAISPQSTLDKALVPWETRYHTAWGRDFSGRYGDAAQVSAAARRVTLLYDPYEPLDSGHVARFRGANVVKLRTPLLGHRLGSSLQQMGILAPITLAALDGTLTETAFYRLIRARKTFPRYQRELFKRALDRGRPDLARRLGRWVLTRGDNRYIRQGLLAL